VLLVVVVVNGARKEGKRSQGRINEMRGEYNRAEQFIQVVASDSLKWYTLVYIGINDPALSAQRARSATSNKRNEMKMRTRCLLLLLLLLIIMFSMILELL